MHSIICDYKINNYWIGYNNKFSRMDISYFTAIIDVIVNHHKSEKDKKS